MNDSRISALLDRARPHCSLLRTEVGIPVAFLAGQEVPVSFEPGTDRAAMAMALARFAAIPAQFRDQAARALFAAAQQSFADGAADFGSAQAQLDWEAEMSERFRAPRVPRAADDIWALVAFTGIEVYRSVFGPLKGATMVRLGGDCAWDGEHGIDLYFAGGTDLVAVGEYNG